MRKNIILCVVLTSSFFLSGFGMNDFFQAEQSPVSFYENLLLSGERALFSGEYQRAIKELEIAAFGLFHRKISAAKAYILMSLSYYHLENREKAEEFIKDATLLLSEDELRAIELNIDNADRKVLESLILGAGVLIEETDLPVSENKAPETVNERINQLLEERKKQQPEQLKEKAEIPVGKDEANRPAEKIQDERTSIEGLEELFVLDESVQKSGLLDIRIQKGSNSISIGILFPSNAQHQVFEIIEALPNRIVIDISDVTGIKAARSIGINDFGISSIRTGMFEVNVARVVFDAVGDLPTYRIEIAQGGLRVVIEKSPL